MALDTAAWVAQATAALLDDAPAVEFVPVVPPALTFRQTHLPEYTRRVMVVYHAIAGWSSERTAPLHPFREAAERAFEVEAETPWRMALAELERRAGIAS